VSHLGANGNIDDRQLVGQVEVGFRQAFGRGAMGMTDAHSRSAVGHALDFCRVTVAHDLDLGRRRGRARPDRDQCSWVAVAPRFSSSRRSFVVPGVGAVHGRWARSQANTNWAGVMPFRSLSLRSRSTRDWLARRASTVKWGRVAGLSALSKAVRSSMVPVRKPRPKGL
jgi:hypothetical protein